MNRITQENLKVFALFSEMSDDALAAIAADCIVQHFGEGELVIGHTDTSFDVLLLLSGHGARVALFG